MDFKQFTVGMRIFKTAIAIFLCLVISDLRSNYLQQDVLVFYSVIAAVQCIQKNRKHSIQMSLNRTGGTLIGAITGCLVLYLLLPLEPHKYIGYLIISLAVIPLINTCLIFKIPAAVFTCCTTFFSIVINHADDIVPYAFAWSRTLDTLMGILIALAVNLTFSIDRMHE